MIDINVNVYNPDNDFLCLSGDKDVRKYIRDEVVLFSDQIIKINRFSVCQDRNILITPKAIYNLKKKDLKRRIDVNTIKGITCTQTTSEFVIHCLDLEHDYNYTSVRVKKIIYFICGAYTNLVSNINKTCFPISVLNEKSLSHVVTTKNEKKKDINISRMPQNCLVSMSDYLYGNFGDKGKRHSDILESKSRLKDVKEVNGNTFKIIKVIQVTTFYKLYAAECISLKKLYIIKSIRKDCLIDHSLVNNIIQEKKQLEKINNTFILTPLKILTDKERIHYIYSFMKGIDMYTCLINEPNRMFDEDKAKFYIYQISSALDYLHSLNIVIRDLKLEDILVDESGYIKLYNLSLHKQLKDVSSEKSFTICGSPEYLPPEMILGKGYNKSADWWALGIMFYELVFGSHPFYNQNSEKMYELICFSELRFPVYKLNNSIVSQECIDIISGLLDKNPSNRIGKKGLADIKTHAFFTGFNFEGIDNKKTLAPMCNIISKLSNENCPDVNNKDIFNYKDLKTNVYNNIYASKDFEVNSSYNNDFSIISEDKIKLINDNENLFLDF